MMYLRSEIYIVNLVTVFTLLVLLVGIYQISKLHRKGELWNFIIGRFHHPRETERYFCFLDLNQSTTIAENLGHIRFGSFLKDFYSDMTDSIRYSGAEVYQYVGDEIVLTWPASAKTNLFKVIGSIFLIKEVFWAKSDYYLKRYGYVPAFKVGIHGGTVLVTWVGEVKKEIIYIGDVMNTTARIRSECSRLNCDFLVSRFIKDRIPTGSFEFTFTDKLLLRGKSEKVEVFCVHEK